jgi:hypothetical protein
MPKIDQVFTRPIKLSKPSASRLVPGQHTISLATEKAWKQEREPTSTTWSRRFHATPALLSASHVVLCLEAKNHPNRIVLNENTIAEPRASDDPIRIEIASQLHPSNTIALRWENLPETSAIEFPQPIWIEITS